MNQYEVVITGCKRLEQLLESRFGAAGRGLHEKVTSVARHLPLPVLNKLRYIASVRNQVVHGTAELTDEELGDYSRSCQWARVAVEQLPQPVALTSPTQQEVFAPEPLPQQQVSRPTVRAATNSPPRVVTLAPSPLTPRAPRPAESIPAPVPRKRPLQRRFPTLRSPRRPQAAWLGRLLVAISLPVVVACGVFFLHRSIASQLAAEPSADGAIFAVDPARQPPPAALPVIAPGPPGIHRSLTQRR